MEIGRPERLGLTLGVHPLGLITLRALTRQRILLEQAAERLFVLLDRLALGYVLHGNNLGQFAVVGLHLTSVLVLHLRQLVLQPLDLR